MKLINPEVRIENTSRCNANCVMCPRDEMTRKKVTMDLSHFKYLVDQSKELGAKTISVFGFGEPLMDKGLEDKIRYCSDLGLETFITTNCDLLDGERAHQLIKAGLTHIRFSVHGIFTEGFNETHNGVSFLEVIRNVGNFKVINKKLYNSACKISVSVIPMSGETIESIKAFWKNVDWLEIWRPHNWGGKKEYRTETSKKLKTCGRANNGPVQIQADGLVIPCCFLTDAEIVLGDTHQNTIEEILKSEVYEEFREKHKTSELEGLPCSHCDQRYILDENPLLYSSRDPGREIGKTSSTKFKIIGD